MTTTEVANRLVALCQQGKWEAALDELYSPDAVSIEPPGQPFPEKTEGMSAIKAKAEAWSGMVEEVHGMTVEGPVVGGDYFTCSMSMDITMKGQGRSKSDEICLYKVQDGKIISEQFFY